MWQRGHSLSFRTVSQLWDNLSLFLSVYFNSPLNPQQGRNVVEPVAYSPKMKIHPNVAAAVTAGIYLIQGNIAPPLSPQPSTHSTHSTPFTPSSSSQLPAVNDKTGCHLIPRRRHSEPWKHANYIWPTGFAAALLSARNDCFWRDFFFLKKGDRGVE